MAFERDTWVVVEVVDDAGTGSDGRQALQVRATTTATAQAN
jgi:hypothetical protein